MNQFDLQPQDTRPTDGSTTPAAGASTPTQSSGPLGPVAPSAPSAPIPPYQPSAPTRPAGPVDTTEANWAVGSHLSAFAPAVISAFTGLPGFSALGPLAMLFATKDHPLAHAAAKDSLNFEITWNIAMVVALVTIIGIPLIPVIAIFMTVCHILGAVRASKGEDYRYPMTLRLIN